MADKLSILKQYWNHPSFRPGQEAIIDSVLADRDTLALLPTGGGKSLCFQVPAMLKPGLCLVVSPLIALMKDQVENLRKKNITAFSIYSGMNRQEVLKTLQLAANSNCKFLYVSPERLKTRIFQEFLPSLQVNILAVDEAHCISQWGYDFRPSYLLIAELRDELPHTPVLALSASATESVQRDITEKLRFSNPNIFLQSFSRPNLSFSAFSASPKINKILHVVSKVQGSGLIYCSSRKKTAEISELLNQHGLKTDFYHAGLQAGERSEKQEAWQNNKTRIIVCTNAFGMGIDKPDVRFVIHAGIPDSLENYYQEAGRAGRDGKKSYAILLYDEKEMEKLKQLPAQRYPDLEFLRKVYASLMNFLQIPSGTGEGNTYDFDLQDFSAAFNLDFLTVQSVLKTFEQEGLIVLNDQAFSPAKLQVVADRETMEGFGKSDAQSDQLLKTLLRTYSGIMDQPVSIFEKQLVGLLRISLPQVCEALNLLHTQGLVNYLPQKEKPQIVLFQNRVVAADLMINIQSYRQRKKLFGERIDTMINFAYSTTLCRSVMIGNYFGDKDLKPCGVCDNCIASRKKAASAAEFEKIHKIIVERTGKDPVSIRSLVESMPDISREKTLEVIRFLEAEKKISLTEQGLIQSIHP